MQNSPRALRNDWWSRMVSWPAMTTGVISQHVSAPSVRQSFTSLSKHIDIDIGWRLILISSAAQPTQFYQSDVKQLPGPSSSDVREISGDKYLLNRVNRLGQTFIVLIIANIKEAIRSFINYQFLFGFDKIVFPQNPPPRSRHIHWNKFVIKYLIKFCDL